MFSANITCLLHATYEDVCVSSNVTHIRRRSGRVRFEPASLELITPVSVAPFVLYWIIRAVKNLSR